MLKIALVHSEKKVGKRAARVDARRALVGIACVRGTLLSVSMLMVYKKLIAVTKRCGAPLLKKDFFPDVSKHYSSVIATGTYLRKGERKGRISDWLRMFRDGYVEQRVSRRCRGRRPQQNACETWAERGRVSAYGIATCAGFKSYRQTAFSIAHWITWRRRI